MIAEVILTEPGTKPTFHKLEKFLCISHSFPPRTGPWSKMMLLGFGEC